MENVRTENRDGLLIVTIDRPKVLNALNAQTIEEIFHVFLDAREDEKVKAVIVTGGGEKAFVAGADINELSALGNAAEAQAKAAMTQAARGGEMFKPKGAPQESFGVVGSPITRRVSSVTTHSIPPTPP